MSDLTRFEALLAAYVVGECSPPERDLIEQTVARSPEARRSLEQLCEAHAELRASEAAIDPERMVMAVLARVRAAALPSAQNFNDGWTPLADSLAAKTGTYNRYWRIRRDATGALPSLGTWTRRWGVWIGAMALVVGMMNVLLHAGHVQHTAETHAYTTRDGQQAVVHLDDGTRMTLAPRTTVHVSEIGTRSRTTALDSGEAYFEVAHASESPFTVRSGTATATVLGTAFLVRHDAGAQNVHVAVIDGKVRVVSSARLNGVTLTTGQAVNASDSAAEVSTADDLAPGIEWVSGHAMFRNVPLSTVLQTVTQWYGYHFHYADQDFGKQRVTIMISTRSSARALAAIEQMLQVNMTVAGDIVTIVPQLTASNHRTARIRTYDLWIPKNGEVGR